MRTWMLIEFKSVIFHASAADLKKIDQRMQISIYLN